MTSRILCVLGIVLLAAPFLYADNTATSPTPPTPAQVASDEVARLTVLLTLTTAQQTSALATFTTEQTALAGYETSLTTARTALKTAVESNAATIGSEAAVIGTLLGQEVLAQATAQAAFYASLTADQQTKYAQLIQTGILGPGLGGRGGPGGPGGRPGGPGGPGH